MKYGTRPSVNITCNRERYMMRKIIAGMTAAIIVCFIVTLAVSCEDLFRQDASQQNGGQDDTDDDETGEEEEIDVVLSPGAALPMGNLQDKFAAIAGRADQNVYYDIVVDQDQTYNPMTISTAGTNVQVTLHSDSTIRTLTLGSPGAIITVDKDVTLILKDIILQGQPNNNWELVTVNEGGTLKMLAGAKVTGNENVETTCGGVAVNPRGTFIMESGEISYNKSTHESEGSAGGVFVSEYASFTMRGGIIHHNEVENYGGGVLVNRSTFIMNGGEIAANKAWYGGGVFVMGGNIYWEPYELFEKKPLPGTDTSGVIWGYPANGKENYANGPAVYFAWHEGYYDLWRESTLGEYDSISTAWPWAGNPEASPESGWEYKQ
jgi:hypothetical protein